MSRQEVACTKAAKDAEQHKKDLDNEKKNLRKGDRGQLFLTFALYVSIWLLILISYVCLQSEELNYFNVPLGVSRWCHFIFGVFIIIVALVDFRRILFNHALADDWMKRENDWRDNGIQQYGKYLPENIIGYNKQTRCKIYNVAVWQPQKNGHEIERMHYIGGEKKEGEQEKTEFQMIYSSAKTLPRKAVNVVASLLDVFSASLGSLATKFRGS